MRSSPATPVVSVLDGHLRPLRLGPLVEAYVRRALSVPTQCELTYVLEDHPPSLAPLVGEEVTVRVEQAERALFEGSITSTEVDLRPDGQARLTLRAYDSLQRLRRRYPLRTHSDTNPKKLAETLLGPLGWTPRCTFSNLPDRALIFQIETSDLDLLVQEAGRAGLFLRVDGTTVDLLSLDGDAEAPRTLAPDDKLIEGSCEHNLEGTFSSVEAQGWEPGGRTTRGIAFSLFEAASEHTIAGRASRSDDETLGLASAVCARGSARAYRFRAVVHGDASWLPGRRFRVERFPGVPADHLFVVSALTHRIGHERGFVTELESTPPTFPIDPPGVDLALGEIIDVGDPEQRSRVRARLPALGNLETGWMPVCLPGAGPRRGALFIPNVDDRVLIVAPRKDFGHGIVLGGLFGPHPSPSAGTDNGQVSRYIIGEENGFRVELDRGAGVLRVADGRGTSLELNPDITRLASSRDLVVEAPGRALKLRASTIDLEKA